MTTLEPGELLLSVEAAAGGAVGLPEGDGAEALGVPDRRRRGRAVRRRDADRARRRRPDAVAPAGSLEDATPLPRNAYKVDVARALVKRAVDAVEAST